MAAVTWKYAKNSKSGFRPLNVSKAVTGSAQSVIAAPGAGNCIVIDRLILTVDAAAAVSLYVSSAEDGNYLVFNDFAQYGGILAGQLDGVALPANTALLGTISAGNAKVTIFYHIEPVN